MNINTTKYTSICMNTDKYMIRCLDGMQSLQKSQRIKRYVELVEMWKFNPNFIEEHDVHYQTQRVDGMPLTTEAREVIENYLSEFEKNLQSRLDEVCKKDKSHSEVLSQ